MVSLARPTIRDSSPPFKDDSIGRPRLYILKPNFLLERYYQCRMSDLCAVWIRIDGRLLILQLIYSVAVHVCPYEHDCRLSLVL